MNESIMFDFKDWYDRVADWLPDDCIVCEIGVADGISALYLAQRLNDLGKKFKLYMVDNMDYGGYDQLVKIYENIIESGLGHSIVVLPVDSVNASKRFNDNSLHFVFLDASHLYPETKESIISWTPKIIDDWYMSGHDYFEYRDGVGRAVDEIIPVEIMVEGFESPQKLLQIENTSRGCGIFYFQKKNYPQLKI